MPGHTPEDRQFKSGYDSFRRATPDRASQNFGSNIVIGRPDPSGGRRQAYEDMASKGIRSLSGGTTDDRAGVQARIKQRATGFQPQGSGAAEDRTIPAEGRITETAAPTGIDTALIKGFQKAKETGGELLKKLSPLANIVGSTQARKTLLTNLKKGEITDRDRDTLALLLGLERTQGGDFITQSGFDANPELFMSEMEKITELPMDDIQSYFDRMDNMNLGDTAKTMFGDVTGTRDTEGIITLENVTDNLGTEGLQFLKTTNPEAYYRLRPNDPDLANESFVSTGDPVADRRFNAKIMEARALAADKQSRQDANMGQGIMASSPAFASPASQYGIFIGKPGPFIGNFVDTDGDGIDDRFQTGPGQPRQPFVNPKAPLPGTSGTVQPVATGITPFDVRQFYASLPQYTQQGIMNPNLAQFYQNLGMFPGMNV